MMKLYGAMPSPFVRMVRVCALELGLDDAVSLVLASGHPLDAGTLPLAENPLGKIPALARDGGPALYDSRVICQYLSDYAGGGLYPPAPRHWETLTLEATGCGIMDAAVLMVYEVRCRPEEARSSDWVEAQWEKIARSLDALEERWLPHLAGPVDMGAIAVGVALEYLDFRQSDRDWRKSRKGLADWQAGFSKRSSMQQTQPSD